MGRQSTQAEREKRIRILYTMLINGYTATEIRHYCRQEWNIKSNSTSDKYIKQAKQIIYDNNAKTLEELRSTNTDRLTNIYKKQIERKEYADAVKTLREMHRINGLESKNVNVSGEVNTNINIKDQLNEIFEKTIKAKKLDNQ
jgi:hypothetical protein